MKLKAYLKAHRSAILATIVILQNFGLFSKEVSSGLEVIARSLLIG